MRNPDPENEIYQIEAPEHRPANAGHSDTPVKLVAPGDQPPQRDEAQRQQHRQVTPARSLERPPEVFSYVVHATWLSRDRTPSASFPVLRETVSRARFQRAATLCFRDRSNRRTPSPPLGTTAHTPAARRSCRLPQNA